MIEGLTIVMGLVLAGPIQEPAAGAQPAARGPVARSAEPDGWTDLFNGRDLSGWYTFLQKHGKNHDPDGVITIEDGAIHLYKHAAEGSTVVMGYIATEQEYGDYHLRFQYRWGKKKFQPRYALKRDAGLYYHLTGPDAVWPRALQFQVEQTNVGDLIALFTGWSSTPGSTPRPEAPSRPPTRIRTGAASRAFSGARESPTRSGCPAPSRSRAGTPSR